MSGRLTFICVLEANLALTCVPSARRWPLRLFIPKWTVRPVILPEQSQLELGCVSGVNPNGRTIWIADAHRNNGKRFLVRADEKVDGLWNWNRRFALAANWFDKHPGIFPHSASLNGSESGGGLSPRQVLRLFRTRNRRINMAGK
jgi:hypothetical protein